jgi:hypothetical protein
MGPKGFETIRSTLQGAGIDTSPSLGRPNVLVTPQVKTEQDAVRYITIKEKHVPHAQVLNALEPYLNSDHEESARKSVQLNIVDTSPDSITFEDLHYPDSE